jgi:hypothetical protein
MVSALFYTFIFSSWGLGLIAFISLIGINVEKWQKKKDILDFELKEKTMLLDRLTSPGSMFNAMLMSPSSQALTQGKPQAKLPEKVRELMKSSPDHPEVAEIDGFDEIIGVRFEAENYPPGFDDDEE